MKKFFVGIKSSKKCPSIVKEYLQLRGDFLSGFSELDFSCPSPLKQDEYECLFWLLWKYNNDIIWLNDESPIFNQLPNNFKSAAILLHPFIQMPVGWEIKNREEEHIYPTEEEILKLGKPIRWEKIMRSSSLTTFAELAVALKTSYYILNREYARDDLAERLDSSITSDIYFPNEDFPTIFLINDLLEVLGSKGAKQLNYSDPIFDKNGVLEIKNTTSLDLCNLSHVELIITDENMDFAFMNVYDSFITLIMAKAENIKGIVELMNWEAIVGNENTYINWYSEAYKNNE